MKQSFYLLIILAFVSFNSFETNDCIQTLFKRVDPIYKDKYKKTITENKSIISHSIDSSSYMILRKWTSSGVPVLESISNIYGGICFRKEYYNNGILKAIGYRTINSTPIGIWKFYSEEKHLDSTINYDKIYKVSFCEFYAICENRGLTTKSYGISFDNEKRKWIIENWIHTQEIPVKFEISKKERIAYCTGIKLQVDSMKFEDFKKVGFYIPN